MSHIANIIRKELRELLTPGSVISVLIMVVLFAGLGGLIGGEVDKAQALPVFGLANGDNGTLEFTDESGETYVWDAYETLKSYYTGAGVPESEIDKYIIPFEIGDGDDIVKMMNDMGLTSAIVIPKDFSTNIMGGIQSTINEYYLYEPTGMFGSISSTVISTVVGMLNSSLSKILISVETGSDDYSFLTNPIVYGSDSLNTIINGVPHQGVSPQDIAGQVSSQTMMIPIIIMIIIMMVGSIVISSMGSEKENKTLETLLTLPIKRTSIVTGKIVAAAIVGLVYGLAYMVGMSIYMGSMMSATGGSVNLAELGLSLGTMDYALVMISMFLAIICALGICMILGAFAKNYKSAQTMTMPLSILAMIPMFIVMFSGWYGAGSLIQGVTFAIPFSHPMMAMQALMYNDYTLVLSGIAYMAIFAVITILITVKLYNSDVLITGLGQNKYVQKLTKK